MKDLFKIKLNYSKKTILSFREKIRINKHHKPHSQLSIFAKWQPGANATIKC